MLTNSSILITGGTGSFGHTFVPMTLAKLNPSRLVIYSRNEMKRKDYYKQLEKQQRGTPEITGWLEWFLDCLGSAVSSAEITLGKVLLKAQLWDKINRNPVNERQRLVINRMLEDGFKGLMNTSKYAKLAKCSTDTGLRDINELKARGI